MVGLTVKCRGRVVESPAVLLLYTAVVFLAPAVSQCQAAAVRRGLIALPIIDDSGMTMRAVVMLDDAQQSGELVATRYSCTRRPDDGWPDAPECGLSPSCCKASQLHCAT